MKKRKADLYFLPAKQGDCILFQYQDKNFQYHNILIDGGNRLNQDFKLQKAQILKIIENGKRGRLDLVVITHSDDDHIKGILNLVCDKEIECNVDKYWFNSEKSINALFSTQTLITQKYQLSTKNRGRVKSSRTQDNNLYDYLETSDKWDSKVVKASDTLSISNATLTVLSPSIDKLKQLNAYWPKQPIRKKRQKSSASKKPDHEESIENLFKNLDSFEEDQSPVNGASIAFQLECDELCFLFTSDAHPSVIIDSLKRLKDENSSDISYDVVKLSHHGSKKNTNSELLNLIQCDNFVISANASKPHYHPDKETIARIIDHYGDDIPHFYFTYDNDQLRKIFKNEDYINIHYPQVKEEGIRFTYEY